MVIKYDGANDIANLLGVSKPAISNWLARWTTYPEPDAVIAGNYGWLPEKRLLWLAWRDATLAEREDGSYAEREEDYDELPD